MIDAFVESRYMMFIKYAAVQLQQLGLRKQMDMFSKDKPSLAIDGKDKSEECEVNIFKTICVQYLDDIKNFMRRIKN